MDGFLIVRIKLTLVYIWCKFDKAEGVPKCNYLSVLARNFYFYYDENIISLSASALIPFGVSNML